MRFKKIVFGMHIRIPICSYIVKRYVFRVLAKSVLKRNAVQCDHDTRYTRTAFVFTLINYLR